VDYYRQCFEIARRHKVMNPEKMRVEYGKLVYMIQDAVALREQLGFNVKAPLHTVYEYLEEKGGLGVLSDKNIEYATQEILATPGKSRDQINKEIRRKEKAVEMIKEKCVRAKRTVAAEGHTGGRGGRAEIRRIPELARTRAPPN
jgi:hypothetical protein